MTQRNAQAMSALLESLSKYRSALDKGESIIDLDIGLRGDSRSGPEKAARFHDKYISRPLLKVFRKIKGYDSQPLGPAERLMNSEDEECRFYGAQYLKGLQEPLRLRSFIRGWKILPDRVRASL